MDKIKIMIDPGHGGSDRYNRGPTGYIEADGMLDLSIRLKNELDKTEAFEVKLTRDKDMTVGVRERGNMAARWGADMFISEHSNATGRANSTVRGVDVFYSVDIASDKPLAGKFSKAIAEAMGTQNNGCKTWESEKYPGEDYLGVIDAAQDGGVPHVFLIENGFHDNSQDEALLKQESVRQKIAEAQAGEICKFYGVLCKKELNWKEKIVKEAFDAGLITDKAWIKRADEKTTVWFVCAVAINLLKRLKKKKKKNKMRARCFYRAYFLCLKNLLCT